MADTSTKRLANLFRALSHPTRLELLRRLSRVPTQWSVLIQGLGCSRQAVAKHIKILEAAGLISAGDEPEYHIYHLEAARLAAIENWLRHYKRLIKPISATIDGDCDILNPWETG
ncbi:MAG: helix-turn-helix domain-containing protein [Steroidobacteraceae bacterium]